MILRANQHKKMIWKNGGGITYQIDRQPNDDQEDFDWRLSMAQIKYPGGPFSLFPNIDRTLSIINGNSLTLLIKNNNQSIQLDQNSQPFSFPGEFSIDSQIDDETLTDFNVMTKRNQFKHTVQRFILNQDQNSMNISNNNESILFILVSQGILQINQFILEKADVFKCIDNQNSILISSLNDNSIFYLVYIIKLSS
jgi:environmental stress-induced protein Ves